MQHVLSAASGTQQYSSETALTSTITAIGKTDGHSNTALDYGLGRVNDSQSFMTIGWHYVDKFLHVDLTGTTSVQRIDLTVEHVEPVTAADRANGVQWVGFIKIGYAYRNPGHNSYSDMFDAYSVRVTDSSVQTVNVDPNDGNWYVVPKFLGIHAPFSVVRTAITDEMSRNVAEDVTVQGSTPKSNFHFADMPLSQGPRCGKSAGRFSVTLGARDPQSVTIDLRQGYRGPSDYQATVQISFPATDMSSHENASIDARVTVDKDEQSGSVNGQGTSPGVYQSLNLSVHGRWTCGPAITDALDSDQW